MKYTFLSRRVIYIFLLVIVFSILFKLKVIFTYSLVGFVLALFFFRKKIVLDHEDQITTTGTIYAPISGRIVKIIKESDFNIITIKSSFFNNFGIYLPVTCEIKNLFFDANHFFYRFQSDFPYSKEKGVSVELKDKNSTVIVLNFIKYFSGFLPELVVAPGDRGRRQSNIGYFLFGGITHICLPNSYKICTEKNELVVSTETILARYSKEDVK